MHPVGSRAPGSFARAATCKKRIQRHHELIHARSPDARSVCRQMVQDAELRPDKYFLYFGRKRAEIAVGPAAPSPRKIACGFSATLVEERIAHSEQSGDHVRQRKARRQPASHSTG